MSRAVRSVSLGKRSATILLDGSDSEVPDALQLDWSEDSRRVLRCAPESFGSAAARWLRRQVPGCKVRRVSRGTDREYSLGCGCLRIEARHGPTWHLAVVGVAGDSAAEPGSLLTEALLWVRKLHSREGSRFRPVVYLLAPPGWSDDLVHRARRLDPAALACHVFVYRGFDPPDVEPAPAPAGPMEERDFRWPLLGPFRWSPVLARILQLAPEQIRRYPRFQDYDSLRLLGLEFARVSGPQLDEATFGVGVQASALTDANFDELARLVEEILYYRRADTPSDRHPYYRMQAERWLESLIHENVQRLFPELVPDAVYPQIPVYLGRNPGRVDILGIDREGTLAVMELKVAEDPGLPLQSLDYWGRVIAHNEGGDFERRGYFPGFAPNRRKPKIYLVSPVFAFHDSTEPLLGFLEPDVEVWKIAVNQDWRSEVKVLSRTRVRGGERCCNAGSRNPTLRERRRDS